MDKNNNSNNKTSNKQSEVDYSLQVLEGKVQEVVKAHNGILELVEKTSKDLKKISSVLCLVPEKIKAEITNLVPEISNILHKKQQESLSANYEDICKKHSEYLVAVDRAHEQRVGKAKELYDELFKQTQTHYKRKIINMCVMFLGSIILAGITSFMVLKYYPHHVSINNRDGALYIEKSNLHVWGGKNLTIKNKQ